MSEQIEIKRALVSVYDKTGLDELVRGLAAAGVELVSTGGSASLIESLGLPVTKVEDLTGFPECLDGRVKTLHPRVHAGILADRRLPEHVAQLEELGVAPFDLVVVNLYPFTDTVVSGASVQECIEKIDIGGPSMVRAAAKNHASVAIVTDGADYARALEAAQRGGFTLAEREALAAKAFVHTATYDVHVASWMGNVLTDTSDGRPGFPAWIGGTWDKSAVLRYGENPHQPAALYRSGHGAGWPGRGRAAARQGDVLQQLRRHRCRPARGVRPRRPPPSRSSSTPTRAGSPSAADVAEAHRKAHACDPVSAFGGVIATNRPVSVAMAEQVAEIFTEVIVAPGVRRRRGRGAPGQEEHPDPGRRAARRRAAPRSGRSAAGCSCSTPTRFQADGRRPGELDAGDRGRRRRGRPSPISRSRGARCGRPSPTRSCSRPAAPRSGSAWARSTGSTRAGSRSTGRGSGRPARSPPPTRSSRSPTARRSCSTPGSGPSSSRAGRCATTRPSRRARRPGVTMYFTGTRHFAH